MHGYGWRNEPNSKKSKLTSAVKKDTETFTVRNC